MSAVARPTPSRPGAKAPVVGGAGNQDGLKQAHSKGHHKHGHSAHGGASGNGGGGKHRKQHRHRKHGKHHKHSHHHKHAPHHTPSGFSGAPAPLPIPSHPPPPSSSPPAAVATPITVAQARRLVWRAGFGPTSGQAEKLAGQPVEQAVQSLTRPTGAATLVGPAPTDAEGHALEPASAYGHDHCWWLDRMVRSNQPLVERMTFIWHDWFANSNQKVNSQQRMLDQNNLFREQALGNFRDLFLAVTTNPAMLVFLDGIYNDKNSPNENYAREMMELFSLGADRGAYTETDVREMARALTGWTAEWTESRGLQNFRFNASRHDEENKTVFGKTGNWNYEDAVRLCVSHPLHASFFVGKLWSYFVPVPPDEATMASLEGLYTSSDFSIRAVVEAILQHPQFLDGPDLVTPPVVYNAGLLRAIGRPIDTTGWTWLSAAAGQQLFYPPNVSGWDFSHWLDTSTAKARWELATYVTQNSYPNPWPAEGQPGYSETEDPATALSSAMSYWGNPLLTEESSQCIADFAQSCLEGLVIAQWQQSPYRAMRQNALRMLIATSPDMQVS
jgi:uncharacterized protein (DUF1800 family)